MASLMVIVSKSTFERETRALRGTAFEVGEVWPVERYRSTHPALRALGAGDALFLVTVRAEEALWLVGVLESPEFRAAANESADAGWVATANTFPITSLNALRSKIRFKSGAGMSAKPGALAMSLQTPRELTEEDVTLLRGARTAKRRIHTPTAPKVEPRSRDVGTPAVATSFSAFDPWTLPEAEALATKVEASPDAPEAYAVLGDLLQGAGHSLGEYIATQVAIAAAPKRGRLQRRGNELLEAHRRTWLPEVLTKLEDEGEVKLTWRWGVVHTASIGHGMKVHDGVSAYNALRHAYVARFLRELTLGELLISSGHGPLLRRMAETGIPGTLGSLTIDASQDNRWSSAQMLQGLSSLLPSLGHLEELRIRATNAVPEEIRLPHLVRLELLAERITEEQLLVLSRAPWPRLKELVCGIVSSPHAFITLLEAMPALEGLTLHQPRELDTILRLASRTILGQLRSLDLNRTHITDDLAREILRQKASFRHLDALVLPRMRLSPEIKAALVNEIPGTKLRWA